MEEGRFRFNIRKKIFPVRVVTHWNTLSSGVVDAPVKARLDKALSKLLKWEMSLPMGGENGTK